MHAELLKLVKELRASEPAAEPAATPAPEPSQPTQPPPKRVNSTLIQDTMRGCVGSTTRDDNTTKAMIDRYESSSVSNDNKMITNAKIIN